MCVHCAVFCGFCVCKTTEYKKWNFSRWFTTLYDKNPTLDLSRTGSKASGEEASCRSWLGTDSFGVLHHTTSELTLPSSRGFIGMSDLDHSRRWRIWCAQVVYEFLKEVFNFNKFWPICRVFCPTGHQEGHYLLWNVINARPHVLGEKGAEESNPLQWIKGQSTNTKFG